MVSRVYYSIFFHIVDSIIITIPSPLGISYKLYVGVLSSAMVFFLVAVIVTR